MAKFTEEEALEALNGKFKTPEGKTSLQLSERSVKETLATLIPLAGDEMELAAFIDNIAFGAVDTMNRNFIHDSAEFAKNYKPATPPAPAPAPAPAPTGGMTEEAVKAAVATAVAEAIKPFQSQVDQMNQTKILETRKSEVEAKKAELKLSKAWGIDFDNAVVIAEYQLGNTATSQQIFDKAKELFNETLSKRGETYKPQEGSGDPGKPDFSAAAARRKAEKERREKALK